MLVRVAHSVQVFLELALERIHLLSLLERLALWGWDHHPGSPIMSCNEFKETSILAFYLIIRLYVCTFLVFPCQ